AGVDIRDLPDPDLAITAIENAPFVLSLELRESPVTDRADVVLPVAPAVEKSGSYVDWEGRVRPFGTTLESSGSLADGRVLHRLAEVLHVDLGLPNVEAAQAEIRRLGSYAGDRPAPAKVAPVPAPQPGTGEAVLATWHQLLDDGRLQDAEPYLAGTRRPTVALLGASLAKEIGAGDTVTVSTDRGSITVPYAIADLPDRVVWLPTMSDGCHVHEQLGVTAGAVVRIGA
ncbi:MAG: NADH-quinone oxidoreductase subunit, partial [Frankiaceae bacterium]|nr:NADH-quinone oxidoreductase subunit [Frankiaceae bacterium]